VKLPEPFTFFIDRALGKNHVAAALRGAGERVEVHDDHFAQDVDDVDWLADVGARGWVVLTKDARIRANELERGELFAARAAAFMLGRGDRTGPEMADIFVRSLPAMKRALRRLHVPFIATVTATGTVTVLYDAAGRRSKPLVLKP
jgi:hypothetical protein